MLPSEKLNWASSRCAYPNPGLVNHHLCWSNPHVRPLFWAMSSCFLLQSTPPRTKAPFFSKKRKFQSQNLWWKSNINTTYLSSSAKYMVNTIFWVSHGNEVFHHDQNLVFTIISTIGHLLTIKAGYWPFTNHLLTINHSYQTLTMYIYVYNCIYIYLLAIYIYMSDCENPRFTERTFTNLGRSHRLPHVCTIMIYGKLGGYRLQETAVFIYIYGELWIICDIWVSLMWILEKYDDITLKRGIANLGRSHRLPRVFNNFHQFP